MSGEEDNEISKTLRKWYDKHKRDLPWRQTTDPYRIWISEIILQQTRVVQGLHYYDRFVARFPDVRSLAQAEQQEVLKYWQGLGYYSRARNLHEAAQDIMTRFGGLFPQKYSDIRSLKGIGEYTAAAIASFAWKQPYPVIDGNVYRLLGRFFGILTPIDTGKGKQEYRELATFLLPPDKAGLHNQAIMEFGALQCTPQHPDCTLCPLSAACAAYASGKPQQYPVKQTKPKTRNRYLNYLYITCRSHTYLNRRSQKDIWEGLYEFPLIETDHPTDFADLTQTPTAQQLLHGTGPSTITIEATAIKHILSHQTLYVTFHKVTIQKENTILKKYQKTPLSTLNEYPFPKPITTFLSKEP
jgi:A/G-specific adenine glycosylase